MLLWVSFLLITQYNHNITHHLQLILCDPVTNLSTLPKNIFPYKNVYIRRERLIWSIRNYLNFVLL